MKKNDSKLAKLGETDDDDEFRDQGFARPKVRILDFSDDNFISA